MNAMRWLSGAQDGSVGVLMPGSLSGWALDPSGSLTTMAESSPALLAPIYTRWRPSGDQSGHAAGASTIASGSPLPSLLRTTRLELESSSLQPDLLAAT